MRAPHLVLAFLLAAPAVAQRDFSSVAIKVEKVAGSVHMLTGSGGNIAISVGEDGVVLVDDQYAPLVPKIEEAIRGVTARPIRFVLNTHWHPDHTGGNAELGKKAAVIAHDTVRRRLQEGYAGEGGRKVDPAPKEALPLVTFDRTLTLHLNGEEVRVTHHPRGHTDGDCVVYFTRSNVVHMGDLYVRYGLPFVDVETGGSVEGMAEAVERALAALPDDVKVIPGHGPLATKADARKFAEMLRDCLRLVGEARRAGKTVEEMKKENVLAKYDALGRGWIKTADFIELISRELARVPAEQKAHH